ncbi:hypothetical protein GOBAR_DD18432 [Gossypium barbadense]|nr:hypothetical protein GOBAR_DD18432 [Gossypium barbadense]
MDALISKFYGGKSKSFTSLADAAAVSSVKDFAKPEDPYNRKRKNLLARSSSLDKKPNNLLGNIGTKISMASSPSNCLPPLHPQLVMKATNCVEINHSFAFRITELAKRLVVLVIEMITCVLL